MSADASAKPCLASPILRTTIPSSSLCFFVCPPLVPTAPTELAHVAHFLPKHVLVPLFGEADREEDRIQLAQLARIVRCQIGNVHPPRHSRSDWPSRRICLGRQRGEPCRCRHGGVGPGVEACTKTNNEREPRGASLQRQALVNGGGHKREGRHVGVHQTRSPSHPCSFLPCLLKDGPRLRPGPHHRTRHGIQCSKPSGPDLVPACLPACLLAC